MAVAGPGTSLALALLAWLGLASVADAVLSAPLQALLRYLMVVNLALALFNLLPAFPLDGGRVLRAALWQRSGDLVRATRLASGVGNAFAFALIAAGLVSLLTDAPFVAVWSILIGFFLLSSARTTWHQLKVRKALAGRSVQSLMTPTPRTVEPDLTLEQLVDSLILAECISFVPVCEHGRLLGHVDAQAVQRIDREFWGTSRVADVMTVADATTCIGTDLPVDTLIRRMMQGGRRKFLVADGPHLLGVITLSDVLAYLSVLYETGTLREIPPLDKRPGSP